MTPLPPPPPIAAVSARQADVVTFTVSTIACDGSQVMAERPIAPNPTTIVRFGDNAGVAPSYRLTFTVGENGQPRTIRSDSPAFVPGFYADTSDLAPALAAARFPRGAARQACSITYTAQLTPVATAPLPVLYELASSDMPGGAASDVEERVRPMGSDCDRGPGSPRRIDYPPFETIRGLPGARSWTFLTYDVDRKGRAANVQVAASAGNAALDRASVQALSANRYAPGQARHGCTFHFYRSAAVDVVPPDLPVDTPTDNGELPACAFDPKTIPGLLNGNAYPPAFLRRQIEGVAVIGYDTAPWGAIGNLKVIASEPGDAFGTAAMSALSGAKVAENEVGHRGCVRRIRFRLPSPMASGSGRPNWIVRR